MASNHYLKPNRSYGVSLVEILISLAVFSLGVVGLYYSVQNMHKSLQTSMQRDIEASYANGIINKVNPYRVDIEAAYNTSGTTMQSITLPNGRTVWYLLKVDSHPVNATEASHTNANGQLDLQTADIKNIHVYFYHNQGDTTPYRQFERDVVLPVQSFNMDSSTLATDTCRDQGGTIWTTLPQNVTYNLAYGSREAGLDTSATGMNGTATTYKQTTGQNGGIVNGVIEDPHGTFGTSGNCDLYEAWRAGHTGNTATNLVYVFPVSANQNYSVTLGFNETDNTNVTAAGKRMMDILINGTTVATSVDPYADGGLYTADTRSFSTTGVLNSSVTPNVYTITVRVNKSAGSTCGTCKATVSWISLTRG